MIVSDQEFEEIVSRASAQPTPSPSFRPVRRLHPDTVHVLDKRTGACLCHTRFMSDVARIGRELGRVVDGVYEWQLRLVRISRHFPASQIEPVETLTPRVIESQPLPIPGFGYIERLGIAGEITPTAAASAFEAQASETFNRAHYERVIEALQYRGQAA